MPNLLRHAALATLLLSTACCDRRHDGGRSHSTESATASRTLDERLLTALGERRQWPIAAVKVNRMKPSVVTSLVGGEGQPVAVQAWAANENDYNSAMMRLDEGTALYAITEAEMQELRAREARAGQP